MDPKYEKELKRLRNSSDQERREHFGHVPWMDGYDVDTHNHTKILISTDSPLWTPEYPASKANEIIRNMMRVV